MMKFKKFLQLLSLFLFIDITHAYDINHIGYGKEIPLTKDYRIRQYLYNPNEIFLLVIHHGFQSYIEVEKSEAIQTISLGDSYSWSINVLDNRVFIKSLEKYLQTNMTIITNKRIYQFDLVSKELDEYKERDFVYAIKFSYL
ncbi:MAG: TrbG/VirB9 family P-type conjugative transfer protein [Rickettsia sp.]|nr:TrbG/VirB9 family P-type conjugative transfer protein [Rickettsia sp.]